MTLGLRQTPGGDFESSTSQVQCWKTVAALTRERIRSARRESTLRRPLRLFMAACAKSKAGVEKPRIDVGLRNSRSRVVEKGCRVAAGSQKIRRRTASELMEFASLRTTQPRGIDEFSTSLPEVQPAERPGRRDPVRREPRTCTFGIPGKSRCRSRMSRFLVSRDKPTRTPSPSFHLVAGCRTTTLWIGASAVLSCLTGRTCRRLRSESS